MRERDTSTLYSCTEQETEAQDSEITHQPASDEARIGIPEYPSQGPSAWLFLTPV